jgi:hypothetical protein
MGDVVVDGRGARFGGAEDIRDRAFSGVGAGTGTGAATFSRDFRARGPLACVRGAVAAAGVFFGSVRVIFLLLMDFAS